jgi:hypothetical protein
VLASPDAPWPSSEPGQRNAGGRFKGYRTDKSGQPTFLYQLGDVEIAETAVPVLRKGGAVLVRKFAITGAPAGGLTFLAAVGNKIEPDDGGTWVVDGGRLNVRIDPALKPVVRDGGGTKQLLIAVAPGGAFALTCCTMLAASDKFCGVMDR